MGFLGQLKIKMNVLQYIGIGAATGLILGVLSVYFIKGRRNESSDLTKFWKDEATGYKEMVEKIRKEYTDKFETLTREIGEIKGQYTVEKEAREKWEAIAKDKNPEMTEFMKIMLKSCEDQGKAGVEQGKLNVEILGLLKDIHRMQQQEHDRDFKAELTVTKQ